MYHNSKTKVQENRILRHQKVKHMNLRTYLYTISLITLVFFGCKDDDEDDVPNITQSNSTVLDRAERQSKESVWITEYLSTHFYETIPVDLDGDGNAEYESVRFRKIEGANSDKTPLINLNADLFETRIVKRFDVDYEIHILKLNKGPESPSEKNHIVNATDSVFVTYRGELMFDAVDKDNNNINADKEPVDDSNDTRKVFDSAITPTWFDLATNLVGFSQGIRGLRGANGLKNATDGTLSPDGDFGNIVVFMPSGLAYFVNPPRGTIIPRYAPLIFGVQVYASSEIDHDRDGIPSHLEDLNGDGQSNNDDSDDNGTFNFADVDDDGDGVLTRDEITMLGDLNKDGRITLDEITFYDDDGDTVPNHLDPDDKENKNQ